VPIRIGAGAGVEIGRDLDEHLGADEKMSRRHATVTLEAGGCASRPRQPHGTFVDGAAGADGRLVEPQSVLRMGQSLFLAAADVRPFERAPVHASAAGIVGPTLARAFERVDVVARTSDTLLILGESGTGKELAARRFHAASPRAGGPFVAVNCATIPEGIAERLLFGARRGASRARPPTPTAIWWPRTGARCSSTSSPTWTWRFNPSCCAVLETREVVPLGDTRARAVDVGICAATLRDVPERVAQGKFREDLYYRMGRPAVRLPPLRQRRDEIHS